MNHFDPEIRSLVESQDTVFRSETPRYGENYGLGWIGFNHASSWMSKGIAALTSRQRQSKIPISHAFVVTGEDECVEAAFRKGVVITSLTKAYFERDDRYVIFRKPRQLTDEIAERICDTAKAEVDTQFNNSVLARSAITENFVGSLINRLFDGEPKDFLAKLTEDENKWICSELAAYCLNQQPEYQGRGVLAHSAAAIEPQRLFEDDELFDPL